MQKFKPVWLLPCDRNRHLEGFDCYLSYNIKLYFPKDIENMLLENTLPKFKLVVVGIIYHPANHTNIMEIFMKTCLKFTKIIFKWTIRWGRCLTHSVFFFSALATLCLTFVSQLFINLHNSRGDKDPILHPTGW